MAGRTTDKMINGIKIFALALVLLGWYGGATQTATAAEKTAITEAPESEIWGDLSTDIFGDKEILDGNALMEMDAPYRALDAAIVPINIGFKQPQNAEHYVKSIHLIIDENPAPVAAVFYPSTNNRDISFATRVRVDAYTHIRAVAEMNDGNLYMVNKFVKAAGGCSAPSLDDMPAALKRMGKMKLHLLESEKEDMVKARFMLSHPNYSGLQFNQITRSAIPAHYVTEISIKKGDTEILRLEGGISLSENPNFTFHYQDDISGDAADPITVTVVDSEDKTYAGSWAAERLLAGSSLVLP